MLSLLDLRDALHARLEAAKSTTPSHLVGFSGWITKDNELLKTAIADATGFVGQGRHPEHIATLGFGISEGLLCETEIMSLNEDVRHLGGRTFFHRDVPSDLKWMASPCWEFRSPCEAPSKNQFLRGSGSCFNDLFERLDPMNGIGA